MREFFESYAVIKMFRKECIVRRIWKNLKHHVNAKFQTRFRRTLFFFHVIHNRPDTYGDRSQIESGIWLLA